MTNKETIAKAPSGRVTRTPITTRNVLTVKGKDPEYHYRIVNDESDRVQMFIDAGYEIELAENVKVGDKRVGVPSVEGTKAQVSVGSGQKAYVMKIRKDWYDEDQTAKQQAIKETENTMKQRSNDGAYGKISITRD